MKPVHLRNFVAFYSSLSDRVKTYLALSIREDLSTAELTEPPAADLSTVDLLTLSIRADLLPFLRQTFWSHAI